MKHQNFLNMIFFGIVIQVIPALSSAVTCYMSIVTWITF